MKRPLNDGTNQVNDSGFLAIDKLNGNSYLTSHCSHIKFMIQMTISITVALAAQSQTIEEVREELVNSHAYDGGVFQPFDPTIKLTYEALFALPEEQRFQYYNANGGVFAVMGEMGFGLTEEDIDDWHRMQEEEDKEWELEYQRRYGRALPH